ncbi:MAG: Csu type fimbrial protein [Rhizomicrobium sp.]
MGVLWAGSLALAHLCAAAPARGATVSTNFAVKATVLASCTVTAADLDFGVYAPGGGDATATTTIDVTCSNGTPYTIALDGGSAHAVAARAMSDGATHSLAYGLYTDAGFATIWGDGTASSATTSGTGDGTAQPCTVFGKIPAGQYVVPATYTDEISVTVSY